MARLTKLLWRELIETLGKYLTARERILTKP